MALRLVELAGRPHSRRSGAVDDRVRPAAAVRLGLICEGRPPRRGPGRQSPGRGADPTSDRPVGDVSLGDAPAITATTPRRRGRPLDPCAAPEARVRPAPSCRPATGGRSASPSGMDSAGDGSDRRCTCTREEGLQGCARAGPVEVRCPTAHVLVGRQPAGGHVALVLSVRRERTGLPAGHPGGGGPRRGGAPERRSGTRGPIRLDAVPRCAARLPHEPTGSGGRSRTARVTPPPAPPAEATLICEALVDGPVVNGPAPACAASDDAVTLPSAAIDHGHLVHHAQGRREVCLGHGVARVGGSGPPGAEVAPGEVPSPVPRGYEGGCPRGHRGAGRYGLQSNDGQQAEDGDDEQAHRPEADLSLSRVTPASPHNLHRAPKRRPQPGRA